MASASRIKPTISRFFQAASEATIPHSAPPVLRAPPNLRYFSAGRLRNLQKTPLRCQAETSPAKEALKDDGHIPWETATSGQSAAPSELPRPLTQPPPPWPQDYSVPADAESWLDRPQTSRFVADIELDGGVLGVDGAQLRGLASGFGTLRGDEMRGDGPRLTNRKRRQKGRQLRREARHAESAAVGGVLVAARRPSPRRPSLRSELKLNIDGEEASQRKVAEAVSGVFDEDGQAVQDILKSTHPTTMPERPAQRTRTASHNTDNEQGTTTRPDRTSSRYRVSEQWQIQKASLTSKFPTGWSPPRRLSPDALEGIRAMHAQYPDRFTTPVLADHFKVSAEAIRRILKSKWRPNVEEDEDRRLRWDRRGEAIWKGLVERGVHPPKKWREMGIGAGPRRAGQDRMGGEGVGRGTRARREGGEIPWG